MSLLGYISKDQVEQVSRQVPAGLTGQMMVIILTSTLFVNHISSGTLFGWCLAHFVVLAYRAQTLWTYRHSQTLASLERPPEYWVTRYMIGAAGSGIVWGCSVLIFDFDVPEYTFFVISIIFGLAGVSVLTLGAIFPLFASMVTPILSIPMVWTLFHSGAVYLASSISLLIGLVYLLLTGKNHSSFIEENFRQHLELRLSEQRFRDVSEAAGEYLWETDADLIYTYISEKSLDVKGYSPAELIGRAPMIFMLVEESMQFAKAARRAMAEKTRFTFQHRDIDAQGSIRWEEVNGIPVLDANGKVTGLRGAGMNITSKKDSEEIIWHQANFDLLTNLPNRRLLNDRLDQDIKSADRNNQQLALMFIDLDKFKEINDSLGHKAGDALLQEVAKRLTACVRSLDTVAHFGGDEFTIILTNLKDNIRIENIAQKIISALSAPIPLNDEVAHISASIGITVFPADATTPDQLLMNADQAMYQAKNAGRNQYQFFTSALQVAATERKNLIADLRGALPNNQLMLYFQPIVEMSSGRIHKAEALIRWKHPLRGMVSPALWIPLAEETELINPIGEWIFKEATSLTSQWKIHCPDLQVSVNISPVQFKSLPCGEDHWMIGHMTDVGLPGPSIVLEVTEGLMLDANNEIKEKLGHFKNSGMQLSLDDFGTGYSSLSYLNKFNFDYLKIDQSFIRNMENDVSNIILSNAIIVMAHKLNLKVIAEGIETEHQHKLLADMGCDYGQGYLWSRPLPEEEFKQLLVDSKPPIQFVQAPRTATKN